MIRPCWYSIKNISDESADVFIFAEIGFGGITAASFLKDLQGITASSISLHLNSPGGEVFDGLAIYSALKSHPANVTVYVDALAASIASVIAMAGNKIVMAKHSALMIHNAQGIAMGDAAVMKLMADRLDIWSNEIAEIYQERVPGSKTKTWLSRMADETWYVAEEAVAAGLADEVGPASGVTNSFDMTKFKNAPQTEDQEGTAPAEESVDFDRGAALRQAASLTLMEVLSHE